MFTFPYDTTVCKDHLISNVIKTIKTAEAVEGLATDFQSQFKDAFSEFNLNKRNIFLVTAKNKEVLPFAHPMLVDFVSGSKIVIDARSFTKLDPNGYIHIKSDNTFRFELIRATLMDHMINGSMKDLSSIGSFPMLVFSRWLSENITKRIGLNPAEQAKLTAITAFYYESLFREDPILTEMDIVRLVQLISKITYIPINICQDVADNILPMNNIKEYVSQVIRLLDTPKMDKFSTGILLTIIMNNWYGLNAKEIVCVGLEHIPTWYALVYSALNDRSYKTTGLAKVVLANDKKDMGKSFSCNLMNLIS